MQHNIACSHDDCSLYAHSICIESDKFIFSLLQLKSLSCFKIAHHETTAGMWIPNPEFDNKCPRRNGMEELCPQDKRRQCHD